MASNGYYEGAGDGNDDSFLWGNLPGYVPPDSMGVPQGNNPYYEQPPAFNNYISGPNAGGGMGQYDINNQYLYGVNPYEDTVPWGNLGSGNALPPVSTFPTTPGVIGQLDGNGNPITYDAGGNVVNIDNNGVRIGDPSVVQAPTGPVGPPTPGLGGIFGGQTPIPIPGISWPVALGADILLNNGNIFGGGGSITNLPGAIGNVVSNPIDSVTSSVSNLGTNIMGPPAPTDLGIGSAIPVAWPSSSGGGANGGATTSPPTNTQTVTPPPVNQGGIGIVPGGSYPDATTGPNQSGPTNTNPLTPASDYPSATTGPNQGPSVPGIGSVPAGGGASPPPPSDNSTQTSTPFPLPPGTPETPSNGPDTSSTNPPEIIPLPPGTPERPPTTPPITPTGGTGTGVTIPPIVPTTMPTLATTTVPDPRSYLNEGQTSTNALNQLWGQIAGLYGNASGAYGNADYANWQSIANQYGGANSNLTGLANDQTATANTALRTGNLNDVQNLSAQALGIRNAANPGLYGTTGTTGSLDAYTQGAQTNLQNAFTQYNQAGNLSPEDVRNSQQAAREGWAARGLVNSPGAVGAEILNRSNLTQQRQQQAFTNVNTALGSMQPAVQTASANQFDPFGTILGSQYGQQTNNAGSNQNLFGNTASFSSGQQGNSFVQNAFNPYNNYSNDVYGSNFNASNAQYISNLNNNAALQGAQTGANANLASGFLNSLFQVGKANNWWGGTPTT